MPVVRFRPGNSPCSQFTQGLTIGCTRGTRDTHFKGGQSSKATWMAQRPSKSLGHQEYRPLKRAHPCFESDTPLISERLSAVLLVADRHLTKSLKNGLTGKCLFNKTLRSYTGRTPFHRIYIYFLNTVGHLFQIDTDPFKWID